MVRTLAFSGIFNALTGLQKQKGNVNFIMTVAYHNTVIFV